MMAGHPNRDLMQLCLRLSAQVSEITMRLVAVLDTVAMVRLPTTAVHKCLLVVDAIDSRFKSH